jgi:hypothetical protein
VRAIRIFTAAVFALLATIGIGHAQEQPFTQFILNAPAVNAPLPDGDFLPIIDGGQTKQISVYALRHAAVASFNGRTGDVTLTAADLGSILTFGCPAHEWTNSLNIAGTFTCEQPSFSDLSGTIAPSQLVPAATGSLGAVEAVASVAHEVVQYIDNLGVPHLTQLAFSDLLGTISTGQMPFSGVTAGTYTNATVTVDSLGRITNAVNGSGSPPAWTSCTVSDQSGASLTFTNAACHWWQIGNIVFVKATAIYPSTANTAPAIWGLATIPTVPTGSENAGGCAPVSNSTGITNSTTVQFFITGGNSIANSAMSGNRFSIFVMYPAS